MPPKSTLKAERHQLACAGPANKRAEKRIWLEDKRAFFKHRRQMIFIETTVPFLCSDAEMTFDGGWYAIPCPNVNAESGGRGGWTCNTYGVIDPTWQDYGGLAYASTACSASEHDQSIIAHKIYEDVGTAAWTPFEG